MESTSVLNQLPLQEWLESKLDAQGIRDNLLKTGYDQETTELYIKEFLKYKHKKRLTNGFILLGIGSFLGFVSCVLTIINPIPELYYYILYGLTSFAVTLIFLGLYLVFE